MIAPTMTPRKGPTKKLAPAVKTSAGCPHEYAEEEELQLEIDCVSCKGAQDLNNRQCLSAVLNVLIAGARPDTIILKRYAHKRYRGKVVTMASAAASQLAMLNRAIASTETPSDKHCRTCPASAQNLLACMKRILVEDPSTYVASLPGLYLFIRERLGSVKCGRDDTCVCEALSAGSGQVEDLR